ncbi:bifunctional glycosyltransferase family 2/GtrA family protein [Anaeromicropila populeti]|uniref:Putative flippase GtrA (Transmembrane translocase of bactoprenol-linked glucose) n=1 Tax=Anaeromicropila populeti TaxID=37658 RepID=A0A1I6JR54_9FIRM|nr:bifunctional glycosyltransferase family 2/GtrA family protein [Anaeromicropila populeti]SFR81469.1 Putative flippase GtrA (transmembrane translocase of bactoprenol-linked glucose) [Anaeromicropila populeti]
MEKKKIIVVIPAYEPSDNLILLLREIKEKTKYKMVVVNDGSSKQAEEIFDAAALYGTVLTHKINKGKGEAIKTALNHVEKNFQDNSGIVIVDADGQHKVDDMIKVCEELDNFPDEIILGSRHFKGKIPLRSKIGNIITRGVFRMVSGIAVNDTQTGLRAFGYHKIPFMKNVYGSRYEYEMNVLLACTKAQMKIREVSIETVYIGKNQSSHFHVLRDSFRIYTDILKFSCSSLLSFILDYSLYSFFTMLSHNMVFSNVSARIISASFNFYINRKYVFQSREHVVKSAVKYSLLAIGLLVVNTILLEFCVKYIVNNLLLGKLLVEIVLFTLSWMIQKTVVFKKSAERNELDGRKK